MDRADGPLAHHRNARLRVAWLRVADNLIKWNAHFSGKFQLWKQRGADARDIRCRVANRLTRTVFQMVSGRRLYHHPSRLDRQYVLDKRAMPTLRISTLSLRFVESSRVSLVTKGLRFLSCSLVASLAPRAAQLPAALIPAFSRREKEYASRATVFLVPRRPAAGRAEATRISPHA